MITSLATVQRGGCLAGVAVICGGLYLAWSYWNSDGITTDETDGETVENDNSNAALASNLKPTKPLKGKIGLLEKILKRKTEEKSRGEGERNHKCTGEELLLRNAIEFTKSQIAETEVLTKQLLVSERRRKTVKFASSTEVIPIVSEDTTQEKSSCVKKPGKKKFCKELNSNQGEMTKGDYGDYNSNDKPGSQRNSKSSLKELYEDKNRNKGANLSDNIMVNSGGTVNTKMESSVMTTFSDESLNNGVVTRKENIRNNNLDDKNNHPKNKHNFMRKDENEEKKIKSEVANVLSEILSVVDGGDKMNKNFVRKTDPLPSDKEFISFMYVNQGYFTSPAPTSCFHGAS